MSMMSNIPNEILCKILEFVDVDSYFNAIDSSIFPIDRLQYKRNLEIRFKNEQEHARVIEAREKYKRVRQGKMLILSCIKEYFPPYQEYVDSHIHEWDDEIDQYFFNNQQNGFATKILDFVLNEI